jgi:hypothetical protein
MLSPDELFLIFPAEYHIAKQIRVTQENAVTVRIDRENLVIEVLTRACDGYCEQALGMNSAHLACRTIRALYLH